MLTASKESYQASYNAKGQLTLMKAGIEVVLDNTVEVLWFSNSIMDRRDIGTPVVTSVTSDVGELSPGATTDDMRLIIHGQADPFTRIVVKDGTVQIGVTVADADGKWSFDHTNVRLSNGAHSFSATASYGDGLPAETGPSATFTIDTTVQLIDLETLTASQGFIIKGDGIQDRAGRSVSSAGDVNGDGFDDVIVGALGGDDGGSNAGEAYVIFGKSSGFGNTVAGRQIMDLATLTASEGFVIQGSAAEDFAGISVSDAGDINGDGFDDIIVGANQGDLGGSNAGQAYVIFGTASGFGSAVGGRQVLDLAALTASQGFIIQGDAASDSAGETVSSAGDINGDGIDDLIIGATAGDDGGDNAGEAYVVFGTTSALGTNVAGQRVIDLGTLTASQGFVVQGDAAGDITGRSVSSAGDVNGDGFDDLIIGANGAGGGNGAAYVIFGAASGFGSNVAGRQVIDLTNLTADQGFIVKGSEAVVFNGDQAVEQAGFSVSSAGDVNGDGFDDLIVGAPFSGIVEQITDDPRDTYLFVGIGTAYVVFGTASGFGSNVAGRQVIDAGTLTSSQGFVITDGNSRVFTGYSVSSAGDVNGDGFDDLIVGAKGRSYGGAYAGQAFVVFGTDAGFGSTVDGRQVINVRTMTANEGFTIQGDSDFDYAGTSVSSAGDINGDGFDDLMVGAPLGGGDNTGPDYVEGAGEAYVLYGGSFGNNAEAINLTGTSVAEILRGDAANDALSGKGGADIYRSGAGNDRILISDAGFRLIDAGGGDQDKVVSSGTGFTLDARNFSSTELTGIEGFDLTTGNNTLKLAASDVFHFSTTGNGLFTGADSHNSLVVDGNGGDRLELFDTGAANADWVTTEVNRKLDGTAGGDYTFVNLVAIGSSRVLASIAVDHDVTLIL
ncbi:FG-GAP repeat protein [Rhizobium subbaraonis]|uniref:FG-GAP repeat protein n=1 Tax=Rhizobium subbaraonis TaxID=908946 RepID=A0A285V3C0_9HYPH|nr:FG-GAP repeat protein [Rhizobium subbaraonis]